MNDVTLVVTSCNRHSLLQRTLSTLSHHIQEPFAETIIVEDSNLAAPAWISNLPLLGKVTWISNGDRKGQIWSVDKAYQLVKTEYIAHWEDDWETNGPFIEASLAILEKYPEIITVSLRGAFANGHPLVDVGGYPFRIQQPGYHHFGCFTFNPGLRRLSDYKRIGTYGKYCGYHVRGTASEQILSDLHQSLKYLIASLPPDSKQIVEHLGHSNSKQKEYPPAPPKILIAIPACHQYKYAQRSSPIHYDTQPPRIDALRSSWLKDVKAQSHYIDYKFFYGRGQGEPRPDEVFLPCGDTYEDLPSKVKEICRYALANGYSYVYKCDDDTFCRLDRLLISDFRSFDQYGFKKDGEQNYITGGCGYTLSRAAMTAVANEQPNHWAEDLWVGSVMRKHGLKRGADLRFVPGFEKHYVDLATLPEDYIACHAVKPQDMEKLCHFSPTSVKTITNEKPSPLLGQQRSVAHNAEKSPNEATSQKSQQKEIPPAECQRVPAIPKATDFVVRISSGLGNQMFMYAFGEGMAAKTGKTVGYHFEDSVREFQLHPYKIAPLSPKTGKEFREPGRDLTFNPAVWSKSDGTYFDGCWQNEKYFAHVADKIREKFTLTFPHLEPLAEKLAAEDSVAVGVRRGDYLEPDKVKYHGNLGPRYYNAAYAAIRAKCPNAKFYIFSDDPEWCRSHMEGTVLEGNQYEQLYLFSQCRDSIIANSTYHWWGAWLGNQQLVIAPDQWFRTNISIDIVPSRWITIPSEFGQ